jgi:putative ABC transport system substrate-binding protein
MRRREFLGLLGGAFPWPGAAHAQQPMMPVIGFLGVESPDKWTSRLRAFRQGLGQTGYVEGQNLAIEYRWADGQNGRLPSLTAELVRSRVGVIVAPGSTPAALVAKATTATIPIVFTVATDPVEIGLVASLRRPGGNITGVTSLGWEAGSKRLELLRELVPAATLIGLLVNPSNPTLAERTKTIHASARTLGLQLHVLHASSERDFDMAFTTLAQLRIGALVIVSDAFFTARIEQLAALTLRYAVPAIYQYEFAAAGGLVSYGSDFADSFRLAGAYAGRILKGEKAGDLPVQQSTKVELIINLKTAKALGITVPLPLSGRADELIE